MDKKNLVMFLAIMAILVALSYVNMFGEGAELVRKGKPIIREAFSDTDYKMEITNDGLLVKFASHVANEYEGEFLAVYAYDADGNHVMKMKRVVNGNIAINKDEMPSFVASFEGNVIKDIEKAEQSLRFLEILQDAEREGRNFGVERCLMGKRCIAICPAAAIEVLIRDDESNGRIIPEIDYDKCIEGGLCASRCPTDLIVT
ncbi:MAG: 4Fe-4S binding protein [Candidatus Altiarchaeales archaeon]|nr:4Fe-4S binding protein [Candidatus Altiarchaeota archaeon]MCG2782897.1 4Fe-4S binding protein [Candidatus Altiarchaeales archaeon]MBU4267182.1 4Fe-4S binding protein [Candidatus Altiarchaeota archaeon]MBU4342224.1 4Fe-4S binding protein [Candidatus Altiarchaeota archaeon]MBU4406126.1 4Fe-4S binding protein [Candidatus Altiarchaeota archaeon]